MARKNNFFQQHGRFAFPKAISAFILLIAFFDINKNANDFSLVECRTTNEMQPQVEDSVQEIVQDDIFSSKDENVLPENSMLKHSTVETSNETKESKKSDSFGGGIHDIQSIDRSTPSLEAKPLCKEKKLKGIENLISGVILLYLFSAPANVQDDPTRQIEKRTYWNIAIVNLELIFVLGFLLLGLYKLAFSVVPWLKEQALTNQDARICMLIGVSAFVLSFVPVFAPPVKEGL